MFKASQKSYLMAVCISLTLLISNNAYAINGEIFVDIYKAAKALFKKSANEIEQVSKKELSHTPELPSGAKSSANSLDNAAHAPKDIPSGGAARDESWWSSYGGAQTTVQLSKCVSNKLKADPKLSKNDALTFCRKAFLYCVDSNKNNYGFSDEKCLAIVNEGDKLSITDTKLFPKSGK
jgi:hypothetical protein